jgi:hypothetical protein
MTDHKNQSPESISSTPPKPARYYTNNWALGLAIVIIGGLLLARNLGVELFFLRLHNWWAFLILLAAIAPLQQAYSLYRTEGLRAAAINRLASAGSVIFIALIFLLDLALGIWWPVFVILCGIYMMTGRNRT